MKRVLLLPLLTCLACTVQVRAITLEAYAAEHPLVIQTVRKSEPVDLGKGNQTNNLKEGGKVLMLSGKKLTTLDGISSLTVMDEGKPTPLKEVRELQLFVNDNALEALPGEMAALEGVTFIYLFNNQLRAIPPVVARMKGLQGMYFTNNLLTEIPAFVFGMHQLRKFQISKNHVKNIPAGFGQLTNLIHLNLSENDIASLPDSMANLTKLRVCDLSDNHLTQLPEAFGGVQILYQLRVRNNR